MFGFNKRKTYNGNIDIKLNNEYQITTKNNKLFPNVNAYLGLIDNAWNGGMNEHEAALYIATLYYCGLKKNHPELETKPLFDRINEVAHFGLEHNMIASNRWEKFNAAILEATQ